ILHRPRSGKRSGIRTDRVRRPFDGPQGENVNAGASAARLVRNYLEPKCRIEPLELRDVGRIDEELFRQHDQFAVVGNSRARCDPKSLQAALRDFGNEQSLNDSTARRPAEVGLANEKIILYSLEIGCGQKSSVEPPWPPAARITHEDLTRDEIVDLFLPVGGAQSGERELIAISCKSVDWHG